MFSHVIVKTPCTAMVHGITGHPELGAPDYEKHWNSTGHILRRSGNAA